MGLTPDELRQLPYRVAMQDTFPKRYSFAVHFLIPNLLVAAIITGAMSMTSAIHPLEWLIVPTAFLFANAGEWWIHKGPLHHKWRHLDLLFERHTLSHHEYFHDDSMSAATPKDYYYVLFPMWGIFGVFLPALPFTALAYVTLGMNCAMLFLSTVAFYYIMYEWLHLIYHLPEAHPVMRLRLVRFLQHHHMMHHNKRLMQKYNFNVSFPIFDYVFGTVYRAPAEAGRAAPTAPRAEG